MVTTKLNLSMTEPQVRQIYAKQGDTGRVLDITLDQTPEDGTLRILRPDGVEVTSEAVTGGEVESGSTFESLTEADVTELSVGIEPVQDLSHGDPSPSNICPITGHDEVRVTRTGINVWDEEWESGAYDQRTGAKLPASNIYRCTNYISVVPNETYYFKVPITVRIFWYDANKNYISNETVLNATKTAPSGAFYLTFHVGQSVAYNNDVSINYPSTDHDYHAYQGSTYTTSLGQTVYGGTLDMVSGVLTVTHGNIASYNGETLPSTWISDRDVYASGTTPTTGAQVVYELATPLTYALTPQQIKTLVGTNNVWASSGQIVNIKFTYGGLLSELPSDATEIVGKCYCDVEQNGVSSMPFTLNVKKNERES